MQKDSDMTEYLQSFQLGVATVTLVNIGDLLYRLADWLIVSEAEQPPEFTRPLVFPTQCVHIALPGVSVLVDAGAYEVAPDSPHAIPNRPPPPSLLDALVSAGIAPEQVDRVLITHGHHDHFNGSTQLRDGGYAPCFPHARHAFGRADWAQAQAALQDAGSIEHRTLGVLQQAGLLDLVAGDHDLGGGVQIIAAPGESPGHQIVRISSEGQTLYCIGDIYHHVLEVEHASWAPHWADAGALGASRQALVAAALGEDALLVATHIGGVGRLERAGAGVRWARATSR
jgi:glyoxylase-like metal-dependent hydrolase (beta-lactamase superfamily II)